MGFGTSFIAGLGSGISGVISGGLNRLFGLTWSPEKAMKEQMRYNKEIMATQDQYQRQAAERSQQYAKDYWDYTNTENQVQHLKNAGLNIGLMYGQSGAGGMGATGGAHQASPEQPQGSPIGMALQAQQIEQQKRMTDAQINLTEAQASKAEEEAKKIGGVDTAKAQAQIEEIGSKIDLMMKDGNYKEALTKLTEAKEKTEETLQRLNEMNEALSNAKISEAFALATKYSEEARTAYWNTKNAKIENEYLKESFEDRVDAAYYNNCVAIALAAKYRKDVEIGTAQIKQLEAAAKELNERADKENWDKETYRKQVEAMMERWENQTFNERIGLGLQFGEQIVNMLYKLRRKGSSTKTVSSRQGKTTTTETYTESY